MDSPVNQCLMSISEPYISSLLQQWSVWIFNLCQRSTRHLPWEMARISHRGGRLLDQQHFNELPGCYQLNQVSIIDPTSWPDRQEEQPQAAGTLVVTVWALLQPEAVWSQWSISFNKTLQVAQSNNLSSQFFLEQHRLCGGQYIYTADPPATCINHPPDRPEKQPEAPRSQYEAHTCSFRRSQTTKAYPSLLDKVD